MESKDYFLLYRMLVITPALWQDVIKQVLPSCMSSPERAAVGAALPGLQRDSGAQWPAGRLSAGELQLLHRRREEGLHYRGWGLDVNQAAPKYCFCGWLICWLFLWLDVNLSRLSCFFFIFYFGLLFYITCLNLCNTIVVFFSVKSEVDAQLRNKHVI